MLNKEKEKSQEKPSKKRSVWDCFTKVELPDGSKKANCNNCEKLLSCDSKKHGTSQLWRHLKSCGGIEPRNKDARTTLPSYSSGNRESHWGNSQQTNTDPSGCQENHLGYAQPINTEPSGNRENQLGYVQQTNTEPSGSQESNLGKNCLGYVQQMNTELLGDRENQSEYDPQKNRELFVKMVIDNKTMLEHVENPFLQEFARFLQPLYSHVTRRDVEEDCLTFYKKEKAKITKLTSKVSLSVVSYYNRKVERLIVCVAAHFIDNDFKLFKRIIGFIDDVWSIIGIDYERVVNDWGLCNKVFVTSKREHYIRDARKSSPTLDVKCILECFCSIAREIYRQIRSDTYYIRGMMNDLNEFPEKCAISMKLQRNIILHVNLNLCLLTKEYWDLISIF